MMSFHTLRVLTTFSVAWSCALVSAQDQVTLEALKAPSMPAGTIIGAQLNEITRPRSFKALEAALLGNLLNADQSNLGIPNGYALEVQPFMLGALEDLDHADYIKEKTSLQDLLWRNLALSVASTKEFRIKDSVATDALGTGIRLVLFQGQLSQDLRTSFETALTANRMDLKIKGALVQSIAQDLMENSADTLAELLSRARTYVEALLAQPPAITGPTQAQLLVRVDAVINAVPASTPLDRAADVVEDLYDELFLNGVLTDLKRMIDRVGTERYGWHAEMNGAASWHFPTNVMAHSYLGKYAGWLNIGYRFSKEQNGVKNASPNEFILLVRGVGHHGEFYDHFGTSDSTFDRGRNLDVGMKYVYSKPRWAVELEWIHRNSRIQEIRMIDEVEFSRSVDESSSKLMVNFNYAVTPGVNLSYNFGKGFTDRFSPGDLISLVNVNVAFGGLNVKDLFAR